MNKIEKLKELEDKLESLKNEIENLSDEINYDEKIEKIKNFKIKNWFIGQYNNLVKIIDVDECFVYSFVYNKDYQSILKLKININDYHHNYKRDATIEELNDLKKFLSETKVDG